MSSGVFEEAEKNVQNISNRIVFQRIDYEEDQQMASKYDINGFPSIIAIDGKGRKIDDFTGNRNNPKEIEDFALLSLKYYN